MSEYKHLKKWAKPDCYAGASWPEWYVGLGRNRDSCILDESNFDSFPALLRCVKHGDGFLPDCILEQFY